VGIRWSMGFTSSSSVLYVFGGRDQPIVNGKTTVHFYGDFHQFDLETRAWTRLDSAANVAGTPHSARETVGFSMLGGSLIVLGGARYSMNGNAFRYEFTTRTWSAVNPPYPLQGSTESGQTVLNDKLFIHMSSRYSGGPKNTILVLQLNSAESQWTEIDPGSMQGSILRCERECALSVFGGNLVQYDGYTQSPTVYYQDVHILRPSMNTWFTATNPTGENPDVTFAFGDLGTIGNSMFVFGGNNKGLYRYDMPPDCSDVPSAGPCLARCNTGGIAGECGCIAGLTGPDGGPCLQCAAGTYKIATGEAACTNCVAGQYSTAVGAACDVCQGCPTDSYAPEASNAQTDCTCNTGSSGLDGGTCTQCITGKYKAGCGNANCESCPIYSDSPVGSIILTACACNAGSSGLGGGVCTKCVTGTYTADSGNEDCASCPANAQLTSRQQHGHSLYLQRWIIRPRRRIVYQVRQGHVQGWS